MDQRSTRLVYIVTHPVTAAGFLRGQLRFMSEAGFDVTVIASPGPELEQVATREKVRVVAVPMQRAIHPVEDARSLAQLTRELRRLRPEIVNASTPKAGLLGMIAAKALGVPKRIYLLRGLRLETTTGALRRILSGTERIASSCAHDVVCNSESLREAAVNGGHISACKSRVLGDGSSNGVDVERWARTPKRIAEGRALARAAGIADDELVVGFVGRFDPDKGIIDLAKAFERVRHQVPRARLLLVGGGFAGDHGDAAIHALEAQPGVVMLGKTDDLAPLYTRIDVLAFPSYREGFPNVPLEAACAEVPAVGYRSTGVVDAIADGESGTIVARGSVAELANALTTYLEDASLRHQHGRQGRERARTKFDREVVWRNWADFYRQRLGPKVVA